MGAVSYTEEFSSPIAPGRMFHALFIDAHNVMTKAMPHLIKSVDIVSGEGGPGSVEQINFTDAVPYKYAKHRLDGLDKDNMICKYSVVEGDVLGDKIERISFEVQFKAAGNGGSVCTMTSNHHMKGDAEITKEEIMAQKENGMGMFKLVEAYLTENPSLYA